MERRRFLKMLGLAPAAVVAAPALLTPPEAAAPPVVAPASASVVMDATPLVAQPLVAAEVLAGIGAEPEAWSRITAAALMEHIKASNYEAQQQQWSETHGG